MGAVSHESECFLAHLPILEHQPLRAMRTRLQCLDESFNHEQVQALCPPLNRSWSFFALPR